MTQARLQDSRRITLDSSGNGRVTFGPGRPGELWAVNRVSVQVSSAVAEAKAFVYRGTPNPGSLITGTVTGSTGDTDDALTERLNAGEFMTVQWQGGDAGATATVSFWGTIN